MRIIFLKILILHKKKVQNLGPLPQNSEKLIQYLEYKHLMYICSSFNMFRELSQKRL